MLPELPLAQLLQSLTTPHYLLFIVIPAMARAFLAIFLALITLASANFDLYRVKKRIRQARHRDGFMVFNDDPQCGDVQRDQLWDSHEDVSGNKLGFRCNGKCDVNDVSESSKADLID